MSIEDRIALARKELLAAQQEVQDQLNKDRSRSRGPLVRQLHVIRGMLNPNFAYVSQAGQDTIVDRHFKFKTGGTFVDVGAYDGITGSNSFFLERHRGWTGVLVEPVAEHRERAQALRTSPVLEYAVSTKKGTAEFIAVTKGYTQMSGLADTYDESMLKRVRADKRHAEKTIKVPTRSLSAILKEADILNPDFVSLDIEGGELTVLEKFPFAKHDVTVWAIENNMGNSALPELMRKNGYNLVEFCGPDEIYIKAE